MTYLKGVMLAAAIDLAWLMASPAFAVREDPMLLLPPVDVVAEWPADDSLMTYLQAHPADVNAMERLAAYDVDHGAADAAIGPLARALQLAPSRRDLWSALDRAVRESGRATISDQELTQRAAEFVEMVTMYGGGARGRQPSGTLRHPPHPPASSGVLRRLSPTGPPTSA